MSRHILLVGMMGAGKTTAGELVASMLGWPYRDSDQDVERATGMTVPELFEAQGEAAFREAEAEALAQACAEPEPSVISVAGGAVLADSNRALLRKSGTVVWLRARPETLIERVGDGASRPLLEDDPATVLTRLATERAGLYEEVADVIIDVDAMSPEEVAAAIIKEAA